MMPRTPQSLGDPKALRGLIHSKVQKFVSSSPSLGQLSDDLAQQVWLRVVERLHLYEPTRGAISTFVAAITDSVLIDEARRFYAQKRNPSIGKRANSLPSDWSTSSQTKARPDLTIDIAEAISRLPSDLQRLAHDLKTWSVAEIAEREGVHKGTIYRRMKEIGHRWDDGSLRDYLEP